MRNEDKDRPVKLKELRNLPLEERVAHLEDLLEMLIPTVHNLLMSVKEIGDILAKKEQP